MRVIPLTRGLETIVDDEHYDALVAMGSWCVSSSGYAVRRNPETGGHTFMHIVVMAMCGLNWEGLQGDHFDENKLNNQSANLRVATNAQNSRNRGVNRNNTSGHKGVVWAKRNEAWHAQITFQGESRGLGYFVDSKDAAAAYDSAATKLFGRFARLNLPVGDHADFELRRITRFNATGYPGVKKHKGKWRARIKIDGRDTHLGTFLTAEDAAKAYEKAKLALKQVNLG